MNHLQSWKDSEEKIEFFKNIHSYDHPVQKVEWIETHLSEVFVAGEFTYKMKKPNIFSYLNLSGLKERHQNLLSELHLNRILAPGFYLKVIPLMKNSEGELVLGESDGNARVVEWVLKMKTYSRERCLDVLIKKGKIPVEELNTALRILFDFYTKSSSTLWDPTEYLGAFQKTLEEVRVFTHQYGDHDKLSLITKIINFQDAFIEHHSEEIKSRVENKKIVEAHGDLRPEHICLMTPSIFVDRLEFSETLRTIDPLDEIACLDLECEMLGDQALGGGVLKFYREYTGDKFSNELYSFYKIQRALVRSKLCLAHTQDFHVKDQSKWSLKCEDYLKLAWTYLNRAQDKTLEVPPLSLPLKPSSLPVPKDLPHQ